MAKIFFTLQLKVKSSVLNIDIYQTDTLKSLVKRICVQQQIHESKRDKLQNKLMESLRKIAGMKGTSAVLKEKIQRFVEKGCLVEVESERSKTEIQVSRRFDDQSGEADVEGENKENFGEKDEVVINEWVEQQEERERDNKGIRLRNQNVKSKQERQTERQKQIRQFLHHQTTANNQTEDQQLTNAYKIILSKCKNPQITRLISQQLQKDSHFPTFTSSSFFSTAPIPGLEMNNPRNHTQYSIQRIIQPPLRHENPRMQTEQSNSSVKYTYSPLRKSLYVFKGNSSNRFHEYGTGPNRLYNNPSQSQYTIPCLKERRASGNKKYDYFKEERNLI